MALTSESLKKCAVKVIADIGGVPNIGSGIIYQTPTTFNYFYVLTAKHILSEDSKTELDLSKLINIKIEYFINQKFQELAYIKNKDIFLDKNLIVFHNHDFVILKVDKIDGINFPSILVTDRLDDDEIRFSSWSIFSANENSLHPFNFDRSDPELKRIILTNNVDKSHLNGLSGCGIFIHDKNILYGIISNYPNDNFSNAAIECSNISFSEINNKLAYLSLKTLDDKTDFLKREIEGRIVEIYQAQINNSYLNLNLALKRVNTDMSDDWYYDSLRYVDLLNPNYLFEQYKDYFDRDEYRASKAEKFYVPKNNFTLREAYILPLIDRIIYMSVVGELAEVIEDSLIPNVYASRYNRVDENTLLINGVEQWTKLKYKLAEELDIKSNNEYKYNCVVHVDLLNYYDNIDKDLLIQKLNRIAVNENQLNSIKLLSVFLQNFSDKSTGLPQNNDSSALLATFYLNQVDSFMQNQTLSYYRFVDDIKIICSDKYEGRKFLNILEKEIKRCNLSVNSQKTKIIEITDKTKEGNSKKENTATRASYKEIFNLQIEQLKTLSKSSNYQHKNQAFHASIKMLNDNIHEDNNENDDQSRNLKFALNIIEHLGKFKIHFLSDRSYFFTTLKKAIETLRDKPWITHQLCKILTLIEPAEFELYFLKDLKINVLNEKYTLYPYQQFQIWLLFAKHKVHDKSLVQFASQSVEVNDKTKTATTASQILYLSTVDKNFKRILLRKINEGFTDGYFQNRAALIGLRSFSLIEPSKDFIHCSLKESFKFTSKFGDKDLVYYHDVELLVNESTLIEQLYSI